MFTRKLKVSKRHQYRNAKKSSDFLIDIVEGNSSDMPSAFHYINGACDAPSITSTEHNITLDINVPSTSTSNIVLGCEDLKSQCVNEYDSDENVLLDSERAKSIIQKQSQQLLNANNSATDFSQSLSNWALLYKIPHNALNDLLKILKGVAQLSDLPSDARTLLRSPRELKFRVVFPGNYYHFGIKYTISKLIKKAEIDSALKNIEISVNSDSVIMFQEFYFQMLKMFF